MEFTVVRGGLCTEIVSYLPVMLRKTILCTLSGTLGDTRKKYEIRMQGLYFVYVKNGGLIRWKAIRYMWM